MKKSVIAGALAVAVMGGLASLAAVRSAGHAVASVLPVTNITVNGSGTGRAYDGIGAVLGGGGNARYLMDYPAAQREQILDYLFKPGFGASLQLLKLEIGGGANSSDGSEASVMPTAKGARDCGAGYEFAIAKRAVALNHSLKLYGLQWSAPGWVGNSVFTAADRTYLLDWLGCAKQAGLTISYLGGWNENDNGGKHRAWWAALRSLLNNKGYRGVKLVAGDSQWAYSDPNDASIQILGAHDICEFPTGNTAAAKCTGPKLPATGKGSDKTAWASEIGGDDAGAQPGCAHGATNQPCAQGMVRALVRGYRAKLTGYLEWPVLDAMPPGLPYEDRGLVTADQPWSGSYNVNAMTWATAQFTQFASLPSKGHPGWHYIDHAGTGFLQGNPADGSYVTLVRDDKSAWSTIVETTAATTQQNVTFTVTGGAGGLAGDTVHVWSSDFNPASSGDNPSGWFQPMSQPIVPVNGKFTITLQPGSVYSLTTTTGQGNGTTSAQQPPPASNFPLPYDKGGDLAGPGAAGTGNDDEPQFLAAQDGSFELAPCAVSFGGNKTCTQQSTRAVPVFWHGAKTQAARYPYAIIGDDSLRDYTVSVEALLTQAGTSAGLIGRFSTRNFHAGYFDGYVFDVSTTGAWQLIKNNASATEPIPSRTVAQGQVAPLPLDTWHLLSMSLSGNTITLSVDHRQVVSYTDKTSPWTSGLAGLEAGVFKSTWPQAQFSNLVIQS